MKSLINSQDLTPQIITALFAKTHELMATKQKNLTLLKEYAVANLFFEPSTRTRISFELAAKYLDATVINYDPEHGSSQKGETLFDTIETLSSMGIKMFIIRHAENNIFKDIKNIPNISLINAGNGTEQHPTQALLDLFTIQQHFPDLTQLKIAIVGDIKHSRVAHSNITLLQKMGVKEIRLVAPKNFQENITGTIQNTDLREGIHDADIIMLLRVQKERIAKTDFPDLKSYTEQYGLRAKHLTLLKDNCKIMHPGPVNRGIEIDDELMQSPRNLILQQVKHGVYLRMAVLLWCCGI